MYGGVKEAELERGGGQTWMQLQQRPQPTPQRAPEVGWFFQGCP